MTTKLLLRTVALTCAWLLGFTALARGQFMPIQFNEVCNSTSINSLSVKSYSNFQHLDLAQIREQTRKNTAKDEDDMYNITLNLEYNGEAFIAPLDYALFTNDSEIIGYAFSSGQNELEGQLPQGTYNIVYYFLSKGGNKAQYYVIKENVEVNGDLTFTLNPIEATNHITTKFYGPNGNLLKHDLAHFDEDTHAYVIDEQGEVYFSNYESFLYHKGVGFLSEYGFGHLGFVVNEEAQTVPFDIYVNDISDQFAFFIARNDISQNLSKSYFTYLSTNNLNAGVLENNPDNFVQQQCNYKYTPYGRVNGDGIELSDAFWLIGEGNPIWTAYGYQLTKEKQDEYYAHELWINAPEVCPTIPGFKILVQNGIADHGIIDWGYSPTAWIFGTPLRVKNGQIEIINIGHTIFADEDLKNFDANNLYNIKKNNDFFHQLLPAPDAYTYPTEQVLGNFGDNCPINALNVTSYKKDNYDYRMKFNSYFVGRYGEALAGDMHCTTTGKFNGQEVDFSTFSPESSGTIEITVTNTNVEVDGLSGHNTTTVYFDQNQEDMTPPAVEMLHFKNADGGVTDRFATADEGTMEFYASDFNYVYYPELRNGVFECQPVEVLVEYAPYGTEDWNELAVEEVPELFQEPGWGYFYRGSLAEVIGQGQNGWFDLRFRLQDASGNWMDQVVSPAFRIDDLAYSSVATITPSKAGDNTIYNLAGQRMRGDLNTLPHGVYIVGGKKVVK